jgi:hypothetical protein
MKRCKEPGGLDESEMFEAVSDSHCKDQGARGKLPR